MLAGDKGTYVLGLNGAICVFLTGQGQMEYYVLQKNHYGNNEENEVTKINIEIHFIINDIFMHTTY